MSEQQTNIYTTVKALQRLKFQARGFSFLSRQPVNSVLVGKNVSKLRGRGQNFEELRHYSPGDDIRTMDWKVTRRTGKPHVKVYTEERERNVYLAIDQRSTMFFGSKGKMKSVIAAELAALITWQITGKGDRVGAVIFNDREINVLPAKRSQQHIVHLFTEIIKQNQQLKVADNKSHQSDDNGVSFNKMLAKFSHVCGHDALLILLTDGHGWDQQSSDLIKKLRQRNEIIACHIFDPLELDLPKMSQMVVSDGQWQIQFSSTDERTREKYRVELAKMLNTYDDVARKYKIPLLSIDTLSPVEQQLRKVLGQGKA